MRRSILVGSLVCGACLRPVAYACDENAECVKPGSDPGTCEPQGYCSFPDGECASGQRFSELAAESLAGECVADGETTSTTTTTTSMSTSSTTIDPITTSSTTDATTSSASESSTTEALTSGSSSSTGEPPMPDPIGWWPMDDDAMSLTVADFGTGDVAGILMGDPQFVAGHIGGALELDGVNDHVVMSESSVHDLEEFSIAAWILVHAPGSVSHPSILGKGQNYRLRLESMTSRPGAVFHDPDATPVNEQGSVTCGDNEMLPLEEWHHVAATYDLDQTTLRVFVDGALVCEVMTTGGDGVPTTDQTVLYLGYWNGSGGAWFNGILDDVRLYDAPLTQMQIQDLASM